MPRSEPRPPGADAQAPGARAAELLRRIAELSRDPIAVLDTEYRFLGFNRSYHDAIVAILGIPPRIGQDIRVGLATLAVRPDDRARALERWARALAGEEFTVVAPLNRRDGARSWYEFTFRPLRNDAGEVEGAFQVARDVTAREEAGHEVERLNRDLERRIEERTSELERRRHAAELERNRLQAVLDILPVGVWLSDAEGRILEGNPAGRAIWGDARLSRAPSEYGEDYPAWWPDGRRVESHEWALARALEGGEVSTAEEIQIEATDGQRKTILNYAVPIRDEEGRIVGGVAVNVDITARKAEERRQELLAAVGSVLSSPLETESRLRTVVEIAADHAADLVVIDLVDGDGRWRRVEVGTADPGLAGAAERLGRDPAAGPVWPGSRRAVESGEALLVPDADRLPGPGAGEAGSPAWAGEIGARSVLVAPLKAEGRITGALTLVSVRPSRRYGPTELETVTELADRVALALENVRLYDEVRRAVREREEVVALVSHDLRNPLHAIQMAAHLIGEEGIDADKKEVQRGVIQRAASRMERLITDLLNMTRIEAGTFRVDPTPLDPVGLVDEALEMARSYAEPKGVALEREGPAALPAVPADRDRVLQVFSNLIHNAVSFTPEGGTVRVGLDVVGDRARFTVSDSGPGVEPEGRERVFERFWQGTRGTGGGAGLGLSIAKGIVEAHGGSIRLVADGERKPGDLPGAMFLFELPRTDAAAGD